LGSDKFFLRALVPSKKPNAGHPRIHAWLLEGHMLWSTGFIGARLGLPYSEPFTFLGIRLAITAALLGVVGLVLRSRWPARWMDTGHIAS
jgi:drug/metabolite transporter (DMT)-like permease